MGCERCADPSAPPPVQRFQTLVSLMLSSQTKDEVTFAACQRLKDGLHATGGFTAAGVASADLALLEKLIYPVGFYRNKSKFVQAAGRDIVAGGGDIPRSVEGLCKLKGVGPKMAFIAMTAAWGKNVGIGVDTHVHRISNRLQWVKTDSPQQTQAHLQAFLPREEWDALNVLLVGFGQAVCTPLNPRCGECSLAALCPVAAGKKASLAACAASEE
jgi:endonuclease-3